MEGRGCAPADAPTRVRELFDEVVCPFLEHHPQLGLPAGEGAWEPYRWATAAVSSYSFILGDDKFHGMVPVRPRRRRREVAALLVMPLMPRARARVHSSLLAPLGCWPPATGPC